jgi:hypothetical protein
MQKGTITIKNGVVGAVQSHEEGFGRAIVGGQALYETLKSLEKDGWRVEGELPARTTEGEYQIKFVKDESLPKVTG